MREKQDVLAKWMTLEGGKPSCRSQKAEVGGAADIFEWNAEETKRSYGRNGHESRFARYKSTRILSTNRSCCGPITPRNFPLVLSSRKISTALAAEVFGD